jgi:hypothetical protein
VSVPSTIGGRPRWAVVGLAFGVGLAAIVAYTLSRSNQQETIVPGPQQQVARGAHDLMALFDAGEPLLLSGAKVPLVQAVDQAPFPVYRVADRAPDEIWISTDGSQVGLRYFPDLVLLHATWPDEADVPAVYEQHAAEWAGYTSTIRANPAWIVPKDAQAPGAPPANVVHVIIGGVEVTPFGDMPIDEVLQNAESLREAGAEIG